MRNSPRVQRIVLLTSALQKLNQFLHQLSKLAVVRFSGNLCAQSFKQQAVLNRHHGKFRLQKYRKSQYC